MQSTFSIFPSSKKVLDSIKIPFVLYTQPIPNDLYTIENSNVQIPRCRNPNCTAFFNALCTYNSTEWTCSVCGQHSNFNNKTNNVKSNPQESNPNSFLSNKQLLSNLTSTPSYQIVDPSVTFPLTHVIIIGCGNTHNQNGNENISSNSLLPAYSIMQSLPPEAPVWVFVMNSDETARKLVTTAGNISHLSKLPKTSIRVPIKTVIPLLQTLLNAKKSCFWCRVFCSGGNIDSSVVEKLKQIDRIPIRIDFFVDSPVSISSSVIPTGSSTPTTATLSYVANQVPGVIRFFHYSSTHHDNPLHSSSSMSTKHISTNCESVHSLQSSKSTTLFTSEKHLNDVIESSFENKQILNTAVDTATSDCAKPFGFQCKVIVKCGPNYKASCDGDKATLSVIASSHSVVPFILTPSSSSPNLINSFTAFQAVQVLVHAHIWDPPTNTLKKCTNVLNYDFPVSSDVSSLLSSVSPTALFDYWARHNQLNLIDKIKSDLDNIIILTEMSQKVHPTVNLFSSVNSSSSSLTSSSVNSKKRNPSEGENMHSENLSVFKSFGRFGKLNLHSKSDFDAFSTEFFALCPPTKWRFVLDTFVEISSKPNSDTENIIIIKQFPNVYYAIKEGIDCSIGDALRKFVESCKPLTVQIQQCSFEQIYSKFKAEIENYKMK